MALEVRRGTDADWEDIAELRNRARVTDFISHAGRPSTTGPALKGMVEKMVVHVVEDVKGQKATLHGFSVHYIPLASEPPSAEIIYFLLDPDLPKVQFVEAGRKLAHDAAVDLQDMGVVKTWATTEPDQTKFNALVAEMAPIAKTVPHGTDTTTGKTSELILEFDVAEVIRVTA